MTVDTKWTTTTGWSKSKEGILFEKNDNISYEVTRKAIGNKAQTKEKRRTAVKI